MIVQELINENTVRTYSDASFYIHGGLPEGNYVEAIDPIEMHRTYIETDIPIEEDYDPKKEEVEEEEKQRYEKAIAQNNFEESHIE